MARKQPRKTFPYETLWKNNLVLGFAIGLVAGLIVAIIVAMMITRSPVPFNSKFSKQGKSAFSSGTQASASTSATLADPNQPMYGNRDTARDAYKGNTPGGDADAPAMKETVGKEKASTWLQAGAYRARTEAENMRARLALLGLEAHIAEVKAQNGNLYRVRLGPYTPVTLAAAQSKLRENGITFTASSGK
ncbi:MAG: SPOR domain-containing protein [Burkholderiaceae bacterium]|jgi:cell division protein FtsN|nr:SPOR domain-containing protein [Burkholderiaceae bacterium]